MSRSRLPSLNALRAFEAAARHGSVTRAAAELHVTHSAVSHQIRALEEELGVTLLRRAARGVTASVAGAGLEAALGDAFARIARAVERARGGERSGILTVSVEPSFAARWLVMRLGRFRAGHPGIELWLAATAALADFARDEIDVAIRHGRGPWPGLTATRLLPAPLFPACSPGLLTGSLPLPPGEIARLPLLHEGDESDWRDWLGAAGAGSAQPGGLRLEDGNLVLAAALAGQGVALTDEALAADALADGRLVRLSPLEIAADKAYWLVCPPDAADRPKVDAFRAWLLAEVAASWVIDPARPMAYLTGRSKWPPCGR